MNTARFALVIALGALGTQAIAQDNLAAGAHSTPPVETYTYDTKLDIQRIIHVSDIAGWR
ncbi:hypothetical protein D3C80_2210040 [compost metagenome]